MTWTADEPSSNSQSDSDDDKSIEELCKPISATVMPKRASWGNAQQTAYDGPTLQAQRQSTTNTLRRKLRAAQKRKAEQ